LGRFRPQVLFVPGYATPAALVAALWGRIHRACNILMTESTLLDGRRSAGKELLKSVLVRACFDAATVGGSRTEAYVGSLGIPRQAIGRYYDVVDNRFFMEQAAALRASQRLQSHAVPPVFLFVGRLAPEKNISALLRAFAAYRVQRGQWTLRIVGRGALEASLRSEAAALGISEAVLFGGFHEGESLVDQYISAGCFVLPSLREPWGLVANEAMCCSLPVLVSARCGSAADLVEPGVNGFTFDPTDINALAGLLFEMANRSNAELLAMGQHSLGIISRFTPEAWAGEAARLCAALQPQIHTR
jgi:glycosyltransferase involved in cell wall biosynthesis